MQFDTSRLNFQTFTNEDLEELHAIFYRSVHEIGIKVYSTEQCEAWAPSDFDSNYWSMRLKNLKTIFAISDEKKAGFISFRNDGYIDFLYVLPEFNRKGIAKKLYDIIEFELLSTISVSKIYTDASYLAKPFFEKQGFRVTKKILFPYVVSN
ncbi:MAG: GNAT family N-acetyltransferase [Bacteroidetes bacterium]|nr:GNAT family N-acetyltransferase [Bacteroidota bacterium]